MSHLTLKQCRFIEEYLVDGNGTAAAIRAGYGRAGARVAACRALRNANVAAEIAARQSVDVERLRLDREAALQGILDAIATAKRQANPMAQIAGWREIAKMLGFYQPEVRRVELSPLAATRLRELEAMSDEELLAIVAA